MSSLSSALVFSFFSVLLSLLLTGKKEKEKKEGKGTERRLKTHKEFHRH